MALDIEKYESLPSDRLGGFNDRLIDLIPSLNDHGCSIGGKGGFVKRLQRGTWAGHIIEHIAIELQCLAGMEVGFGKTFSTAEHGVYVVVFRYLVESVGIEAAKTAVQIFEAMASNELFDLEKVIHDLKVLREDNMLGPSTWSIVKEALDRGIPYIRLNEDSHIQLGYGANQKRIQASMTSQTSAIAVEAADEKTRIKQHLKRSGIPVPQGDLVTTEEEAILAFKKINKAIVIKPDVGNHGKGATINITNVDQVRSAFKSAQDKHDEVIVEEYVTGYDFRLLVVDGKLVAAAKRKPAHVEGDGKSTIQQLIDITNSDPRRGYGHEKVLTKIVVDNMTERLLDLVKLNLEYVPKKKETIYLKTTANLSQGGTSTDVTDEVSPEIRLMAERTAQIIDLDCVGIDVLATDISLSIKDSGIKVVEVNAAPGFRMHLEPTNGQPRNVAKPMVDMLFPNGYVQVPVVAVTGTNGKTTTCKLITHSLKYAGKYVGLACTTGIEVDGYPIIDGDYSGPEGAKIVIREPLVDHVVLEVARGGIVRRGLGVEKLDVGVLLNIGTDHMGTDWVESQEDLSLVKSTVIESVKETGTSVLNADDAGAMSVMKRAQGKVILFSIDSKNKFCLEHIKMGGTVVTLLDRNVYIKTKDVDILVCAVEEIPITFLGVVDFNTSNALAAIAALFGLKLPIEKIKNGIMTFYSSPNQNPGRMNLFDFQDYKVLVDYGHNPDSVRALTKLLPKISKGRKIALCHGTGSRTDEQILEYGEVLAKAYDMIVLTDYDPRDRLPGETTNLVQQGLLKGGFKKNQIDIVEDPSKALDQLFTKAEIGDLLVIQIDDLEPIMSQIKEKHLLKVAHSN